MLKTLRITFALRMSYKINGVLHWIKHLPLIGKRLPDNIYNLPTLKGFAAVIAFFWELGSAFLWKLVYFAGMLFLPFFLFDPVCGGSALFVHLFVCLTLAGCLMNDYLLHHDEAAYYAVLLMGMNARQYTLVNFAYSVVKLAVAYLLFGLLFGGLAGVPVWLCVLMPLSAVAAKVITGGYELWQFRRRGHPEGGKSAPTIILMLILLGCAYGLPILGLCLPLWVSGGVMILSIPAALLCLKPILKCTDYRVIHQQLRISQQQTLSELENSQLKQSQKEITGDAHITSNLHGFAYLNDLFFKRHKKLLWKPCIAATGISILAVVACTAGIYLIPETKALINNAVMNLLPSFAFIMYIWNRGESFTQALYMNCDRSLLTYGFYKEPKCVLKLFSIRLKSVIKLNLLPAAVIAAGLPLLLFLSGGTPRWTDYLVLPVTILAMSCFFSVHYLTIYYLLQPYTAGTELKNPAYSAITAGTYVVCYMLLQVDLPAIGFGLLTIAFCVIYCAVACLLVYKLAPKTFKIRT